MATHFTGPVYAGGILLGAGRSPVIPNKGNIWYVDAGKSTTRNGKTWDKSVPTISQAVTLASAGDQILVAPGEYDETVTIPIAKNNLRIMGIGTRGSVYIEPSTGSAAGMLIYADECHIENIGIAGDGAATYALRIWGARVEIRGCKIEGAVAGIIVGPGSPAEITAGTHGKGADCRFMDCELTWLTNGIILTSSTYGSCTQTLIQGCRFHNISGTCIDENDVGGTGTVRNLWVVNNILANQEDGTEPTQYMDLNSTNSTGFICGNFIADTVFAVGKIALAAGVIFAGNYTQAESGGGAASGSSGRPD